MGNPTDVFSPASIPEIEIEALVRRIRSHPEYANPAYLLEAYQSLGLEVLPDPFSDDVTHLTQEALQNGTPFSVVRIGDGEMNLLSFGGYPETPNLDRHGAAVTIRNNHGACGHDELWILALREMMMSAILQANIVGVLGLWRARPLDLETFIGRLGTDLRGLPGAWRGMDYMLRLARAGILQNKVVASAHLYFGLLHHLDQLFTHAQNILLLTNRASVVEGLRRKYPSHSMQHISVVTPAEARVSPVRGPGVLRKTANSVRKFFRDVEEIPASPAEGPDFLRATETQLPDDLRGYCCLVGAGPWAEIYCSWIKQRGGVALDMGSGFDLLAGEISRPVHRLLGLNDANPHAL